MRFLGNKTRLLTNIEEVIDKYNIEGEIFCDLFSGTSSVGDFFKNRYKIIANDYLYSLSHVAQAKLSFSNIPKFENFKKKYKISPFDYFNTKEYTFNEHFFITKQYSPLGERMFFTEDNAIRIDGIRLNIEELYKNGLFNEQEYSFLLASLIESIMRISNTTGTYEAFLKNWDNRALKKLEILPLEFFHKSLKGENAIYNDNANTILRKVSGDILYIDPPYTVTDYNSAYHLIESIIKYDYPEIKGITGRRVKRKNKSLYHRKDNALKGFEDILRQAQFKHIMISYSNQGLIPVDELIELAKKFAKNQEIFIEYSNYREYKNIRESQKRNGKNLKEFILYFQKDLDIIKSPLNYTGSKDTIILDINKNLPKNITCFIDAMGGAFNVGANITATKKVVYNEFLPHVYSVIELLLKTPHDELLRQIETKVTQHNLQKENDYSYKNFRSFYNSTKEPLDLFILHTYSFQNMIRFNSKLEFNTPIGNSSYNGFTKNRILNFKPRTPKVVLSNKDFAEIDFLSYDKDSLFYFDPPYFITRAAYNDGKRGFKGWDADEETRLLEYLDELNKNGYKFMLSNVLYHNDKVNHLLLEWIKTNNFNVIDIGRVGSKNQRKEVLIINYNWEE